ncbi:MAG: dihydrodipicolinate synthase family protein, partial [Rectinema subterraneum]|uniref:dihydrodipicolinate synthase family protein n=1 Tax=Rectinema subterraneum TaxID=2653714 RepID=UPI003C7DAFD8
MTTPPYYHNCSSTLFSRQEKEKKNGSGLRSCVILNLSTIKETLPQEPRRKLTMPLTRKNLIQTLFPSGIPTLWCPPLTHFSEDGLIDAQRIKAHLAHLRLSLPCLLVPGSTSEGWELDEAEELELLDILLDCARDMDFSIMIGILRTQPGEALRRIPVILKHIFKTESPSLEMLKEKKICGLAVTAPKGKDVSQPSIQKHLEDILHLSMPIALYQLPQITENEISPETVAALVSNYPNLYLIKDTSGADRVATSGMNFDDVFLVRGAEGDYIVFPSPFRPCIINEEEHN